MLFIDTFIQNKYTKWYNSIIAKRFLEPFEGIGEKHHIIPRALGGVNNKTNIVRLTPKEHFICHLLLTKMCIKPLQRQKMCYALALMCTLKKYNSRHYEHFRKIAAEFSSIINLGRPSKLKGRKMHKIHCIKMSNAAKQPERITIAKRNLKKAIQLPKTQEQKQHMSKKMKGRIFSEESRRKMSIAAKERVKRLGAPNKDNKIRNGVISHL